MGVTEAKEVTYLKGQRVMLDGATYALERTCSVDESVHDFDGSWHYLTCGHRADTWHDAPPNYCPTCGARIES